LTSIATFGNCQARGIASLLKISLPDSFEAPLFFSNNMRTAQMKSADEILTNLNAADVVVFQPLSDAHGPLSETNVRASLNGSVTLIAFPYIFNHGIAGFCRAVQAISDNSYGRVFGEEAVLKRLESGATAEELTEMYLAGELDLRVRQRFDRCMTKMAERERTAEIRLTDFILEHYRERRLLLMHNHPSTALYAEACAQLKDLTGLPIDVEGLRSADDENLADHAYKTEICPVSQRDLDDLGCTYAPDPDWRETGPRLIRMIASEWERKRSAVRRGDPAAA
jgi:hypothetical protein